MSSPSENVTFDVSFIRDVIHDNQTVIRIKTYEKGAVTGTYQYAYDLNEPISSVRAYVDTYESNKSFVSSSYEIFGTPATNLSSENNTPSDFITLYSYDSMDRIIQKTLPNGKVISYNYNDQTLLSSISGVIDNIEYNSMNLMTRKEFSNNVATDLTYDGWTKRLENIDTPGLQNINYAFDLKGNIVGIADNVVGENQYFFYDDLDRLILAGSENYSQSFAYNPLGSILAHRNKDMTTNDEIIFGFEYGKNAGIHAPTRVGDTELLYDANGNLVEDGSFVYVYNDANRLTEVLKKSENNRSIAEFVYDENGKRVVKTENGVVSYYISRDYDIEDGEETVYYFANGGRVAKESAEGMFWYLDDHLGSTNVMIDESGQLVERTLYYPFGGHREGGTEKYSFTGKEFDSEIGLYYFEARYYNPETFVFTQADTILPSLYNSQGLNRYSYCYNNPIRFIDPSGHIIELATKAPNPSDYTEAGGYATAYATYQRQLNDYNSAIAYLKTSEDGNALIEKLENSPEVITIRFIYDSDIRYRPFTRTIDFDPGCGMVLLSDRTSTLSPAVGLAHEMGHAAQHLDGEMKEYIANPDNEDISAAFEVANMEKYENPISRQLGEPVRYSHTISRVDRMNNPTHFRTTEVLTWSQRIRFENWGKHGRIVTDHNA